MPQWIPRWTVDTPRSTAHIELIFCIHVEMSECGLSTVTSQPHPQHSFSVSLPCLLVDRAKMLCEEYRMRYRNTKQIQKQGYFSLRVRIRLGLFIVLTSYFAIAAL